MNIPPSTSFPDQNITFVPDYYYRLYINIDLLQLVDHIIWHWILQHSSYVKVKKVICTIHSLLHLLLQNDYSSKFHGFLTINGAVKYYPTDHCPGFIILFKVAAIWLCKLCWKWSGIAKHCLKVHAAAEKWMCAKLVIPIFLDLSHTLSICL